MINKKLKHVGLSAYRLDPSQDNPREVAFSIQWQKEQDANQLLQKLVPEVTQREAEVVATVIQWLGSNVGMSFLDQVCRESEQVRGFLRRTLSAMP